MADSGREPAVSAKCGCSWGDVWLLGGDKDRPSFFHGPGEVLHSSGEGSGVTLPRAVMIGLGTVELAAEVVPKRPLPPGVLRLGVRETTVWGVSEALEAFCLRTEAEGRM